jgi:hypothetical protein
MPAFAINLFYRQGYGLACQGEQNLKRELGFAPRRRDIEVYNETRVNRTACRLTACPGRGVHSIIMRA